MKLGVHIFAALAFVALLSSCQKMDTFDQPGMLEIFTGTMRVTPGLSSDVTSEIVAAGIYSYNADENGNVVIAVASDKTISVRDRILGGAPYLKDAFEAKLESMGVNPKDRLEFSGFLGQVVEGSNGKLLKITGFAAPTTGLAALDLLHVDGYAKLDKKNKAYVYHNIHVYTTRKDIENFFPPMLEGFLVGEEEVPLAEIDDDDFVITFVNFQFYGIAMTALM